MAKTYRSSKGKQVDLNRLMAENEKVRAVGNMNVNARGDTIDSNNTQVESRNKRVNKQYRRQIGNTVTDIPVSASKRKIREHSVEDTAVPQTTQLVDEPVVPVADPVETKPTKATPKGGLAAAIAKAKEIRQEPLKSPREEARSTEGVKKI